MQQKSSIKEETHTHAQTNGSCWCGEQIKYLFPVSRECLDRAPLILSLWEPPVPWIILSLRALRQTGSHAPFCSMPRHQPTPSTPIFSDPPLHHRGRCAKQREREREEVRDEGRREGWNKRTKWECTKMTVEMQCFLWKQCKKAQNISLEVMWVYFHHNCLQCLLSPYISSQLRHNK